MADDRVVMSDALLTLCRAAVTLAVEYGATFVAPPHLLLALLDDADVGGALSRTVERGRIVAAARQPAPSGVQAVPEGRLPRGERSPFMRYDTILFHSSDGQFQRWLNRDSFNLFNAAAKRANGAPFMPKHVALGFTALAHDDPLVRSLFGAEAESFAQAAFALQ